MNKMHLSLLDEAIIEERKQEIEKKRTKGKMKTPLDVIRYLLPNYEMTEKIQEWHAALQKEKGIKGGVRSGKTYALAANAIALSYINRPYFHLSLAPSFDNIRETIVPALEELSIKNGLRYDWIKSSRTFKIYHGNKSEDIANILLVGADSFIKGITAASGDANEPFSIDKKIVLVWHERISHPRAKRLERAWGGTAEPEKMNWGKEYYRKEKIVTKDLYVDTITTYENKYLNKEYIQSLERKYDTKMREVYMLGKHVNLVQEPAYWAFDDKRNLIQRKLLPNFTKYDEMIIGFDFNVNPICAALLRVAGKKIYQIKEYKLNNSNTDELCRWICSELSNMGIEEMPSIIVTGDASGNARKTSSSMTDYMIIRDCFLRAGLKFSIYVPEKNPFVRDRINDVNKLFESGGFIICDDLEYSITDRGLVQWKQNAEGFAIDKSKSDITHISDAADYAALVGSRIINMKNQNYVKAYRREVR